MTNDQRPMTNDQFRHPSFIIGHWSLVIGHFPERQCFLIRPLAEEYYGILRPPR